MGVLDEDDRPDWPDWDMHTGTAASSRGKACSRSVTSSSTFPKAQTPLLPKRHGLFTIKRGGAGSDVQDFGEEAGSVSQLNPSPLC